MAHLDRNISKELLNSRPAIQDDCLEGIPHVFQGNPPLSLYINGLMGYLVNRQVLLEMGWSYDADTKASPKKGNIGNSNDGLRGVIVFPGRYISYTIPDPVFTSPVFCWKLLNRLSLINIFMPDSILYPFPAGMILKLLCACHTSIALLCFVWTFLLCMVWSTIGTVFLFISQPLLFIINRHQVLYLGADLGPEK